MTYRRQPCYPDVFQCVAEFNAKREPTEWDKLAEKVLIPTPGYPKSVVEIAAELEAGGVPVPPGIAMIARDDWAAGWRPELDS